MQQRNFIRRRDVGLLVFLWLAMAISNETVASQIQAFSRERRLLQQLRIIAPTVTQPARPGLQ